MTPKTILVTGSTDGIGLAAATRLAVDGHHVLLHGRNPSKLADAERTILTASPDAQLERWVADLARPRDVEAFAAALSDQHSHLDVLINNAGVYKTAVPRTADGLDVRFAVNTLAPHLLTRRLLPLLGASGRIVNLSSAAQAPVDVEALAGRVHLSDYDAYAQSKLALTMWSRHLAREVGGDGPMIVAVNPGSLLATKMVREGFGVTGHDVSIGADILVRAALSPEFADVSGQYYDNDAHRFAPPHPDALDPATTAAVMRAIDTTLGAIA